MEKQKSMPVPGLKVNVNPAEKQNVEEKKESDINPLRLSQSELQAKISKGLLQISPFKDIKDEKYESIIYSPYRKKQSEQFETSQSESEYKLKIETEGDSDVSLIYTFGNGKQESFCVRMNPFDNKIAASFEDGSVQIFTLPEGKQISHLIPSVSNFPTSIIRWKPYQLLGQKKEILLAANTEGSLTQYDIQNNQQIWRTEEPDNNIFALDYSKEGKYFATGGKDKIIKIYDDDTKKIICNLKAESWRYAGHSNRIFCIKFCNDQPNILLSGGWDENVIIWDIRVEHSIDSIKGPQISGDSIDYKNNQVLVGSYRSKPTLQLFDFGKRQLIENINWGKDDDKKQIYIYACQFSKYNNNSILAGCSGINEVKYFHHQQSFPPICTFKGLQKGCFSVDYAHHSDMFSFTGADGIIYVAKPTPKKLDF